MNRARLSTRIGLLVGTIALAGAALWLLAAAILPAEDTLSPTWAQTDPDPDEPGPCTVLSQTVTVGVSNTDTIFYYPAFCSQGSPAAPYPGVAFAHGFTMSGLNDGQASNEGHGDHLASWGYVVAIPALADDTEVRILQMQGVLDYMEQQAGSSGSFLYGLVDTQRLALVGHSLGGSTVLALGARDARVKAIVALDPVFHGGAPGSTEEMWDPSAEAPLIAVPTGILGAPPSACNREETDAPSDYTIIYPLVGAVHKASYRVVDASHCDFMDPGYALCDYFCGGGGTDVARTALAQKYMTAWLNYYLYLDTDNYAYIFGSESDADISAGTIISREIDTAPRNLGANGALNAIRLDWDLYTHPIIAGYDIHRRTASTSYSGTPLAQVGTVDTYLDSSVTAGQTYSYTVCSRDAAGNPHAQASEVSAEPIDPASLDHHVYLPIVTRSP